MNPILKAEFDMSSANGDLTTGSAYGCCYLCRQARREGDMVLATGVEIPFDGMLDICTTCLTHLGHLIGMVEPSKVEEVAALLAAETKRAEKAEAKVEEYRVDLAQRQKILDEKIKAFDRGLVQMRAVKKMTPEAAQRKVEQLEAAEKAAG